MTPKTVRKCNYVVCRYCLKDSNSFSNVYFISDDKEVYEKLVKETFNIQICYLKSFDKILCIKCAEDIRVAAKVKQNILDVQKKLTEQSYKLGCDSPKQEVDSSSYGLDDDGAADTDTECKQADDTDNKCKRTVDDSNVKADEQNKETNIDSRLTVDNCNSPKQELDVGYVDDCKHASGAINTDIECKQTVDQIPLNTNNSLQNNGKDVDLSASRFCIDRLIHKNEKQIIKLDTFEDKEILYKMKRSNRKKSCLDSSKKNSYSVTKRTKEAGTKTSKEKPKRDRREAKMIFDALRPVRNNTLKLLTNSNMCLFTSKRTKYACYSCTETYLDIRELRDHSNCHTLNYSHIKRCRGMSYNNVDISNLTCNLCSDSCNDLTELRSHLINAHDIAFGKGEHLLLPFRLEDGFKCVVCDESFQTFTRLSIHMNRHSTSNVCEKCGAAYTNRRSLRNHLNSIHKEQRCSKCTAVFPTHSARANHMRNAHGIGAYKRYCMKCEMTFRYTYELAQHMIDKHGAKQQISDCEHCEKRFYTLNGLKTHIRAVHIGERNYPCSICDMRFFTTSDKKRHERTHGDEKSFSCSFCEVKFRSKDSMRRHLKKQHGNSKATAVD